MCNCRCWYYLRPTQEGRQDSGAFFSSSAAAKALRARTFGGEVFCLALGKKLCGSPTVAQSPGCMAYMAFYSTACICSNGWVIIFDWASSITGNGGARHSFSAKSRFGYKDQTSTRQVAIGPRHPRFAAYAHVGTIKILAIRLARLLSRRGGARHLRSRLTLPPRWVCWRKLAAMHCRVRPGAKQARRRRWSIRSGSGERRPERQCW